MRRISNQSVNEKFQKRENKATCQEQWNLRNLRYQYYGPYFQFDSLGQAHMGHFPSYFGFDIDSCSVAENVTLKHYVPSVLGWFYMKERIDYVKLCRAMLLHITSYIRFING